MKQLDMKDLHTDKNVNNFITAYKELCSRHNMSFAHVAGIKTDKLLPNDKL